MWKVKTILQWEKDKKWYEKKRPMELEAVSRNLKRYLLQLNTFQNSKAFRTGYMHDEPHGVVAIDQKECGANLQETRLYVFPCEEQKTLYIITIGNKDEQADDIQFCKEFLESIKNG